MPPAMAAKMSRNATPKLTHAQAFSTGNQPKPTAKTVRMAPNTTKNSTMRQP